MSATLLSRDDLFHLKDSITLTESQYQEIWPTIDNIWVREKAYPTSEGQRITYSCRFGKRINPTTSTGGQRGKLKAELHGQNCAARLFVTISKGGTETVSEKFYRFELRHGDHIHTLELVDQWAPSTSNGGKSRTLNPAVIEKRNCKRKESSHGTSSELQRSPKSTTIFAGSNNEPNLNSFAKRKSFVQEQGFLVTGFHHEDASSASVQEAVRTMVARSAMDLSSSNSTSRLEKVMNLLSERLILAGIGKKIIFTLLPKWVLSSIHKNASIWQQLLETPLAVSTKDFNAIFNLRQCNTDSEIRSPQKPIIYVRTFTLTIQQFYDVLQNSQCPPKKFQELTGHLNFELAGDLIFVRYIGQTISNGWHRHKKIHVSIPGFLSRFYEAVKSKYPHVLDDIVVQEFIDSDEDSDSQNTTSDFLEQFFIAILSPGALNIRQGGIYESWNSPRLHEGLFQSLGTATHHLFQTSTFDQSPSVLSKYAKLVREYTKKHSTSTGYSKDKMSRQIEDLLMQQGIGRKLTNGFSPICFIGEKFPKRVKQGNAVPFFLGDLNSRQTGVALTSLDFFSAQEEKSTADGSFVRHMAESHCLPFVNTFPWLEADLADGPAAAAILREYLSTVKPLIVCTFGAVASRMALTNFDKTNYLKASTPLLPYHGNPYVRTYSNFGGDAKMREQVIVIPMPHPGAKAYGNSDEVSMVFEMTMAIGWLAAGEAMKLGDSLETSFQLCEKILPKILAKTGLETQFGQAYQVAKFQYSSALAAVERKPKKTPIAAET